MIDKAASDSHPFATQAALQRMRDMVRKYAEYYLKKTDRAFLIRNLLTASHTISLFLLFAFISLFSTKDFEATNVFHIYLLFLSALPIITFSLLQIIYPDRIIEASRRVYRDLSELNIKLSVASLDEDPEEIIGLLAASSAQLNAIFTSSSHLLGSPPSTDELRTIEPGIHAS